MVTVIFTSMMALIETLACRSVLNHYLNAINILLAMPMSLMVLDELAEIIAIDLQTLTSTVLQSQDLTVMYSRPCSGRRQLAAAAMVDLISSLL